MTKKGIYIAIALAWSCVGFSQVKIGGTDATPNPNAMLEVEATNKGFLPPRVALQGIDVAAPLTAHIAGITLYNTVTAGTGANAVTPGYYYNDGTKWVRFLVESENGLHIEDSKVKLGGELNKDTAIITGGNSNTLAVENLQEIEVESRNDLNGQKIVVADETSGVLKTIDAKIYAPATNTTVYKAKITNSGSILNVDVGGGWRPINFAVSTDTFYNGNISPIEANGDLTISEDGIYVMGLYFRYGTGIVTSLLSGTSGVRIIKNNITASPVELRPFATIVDVTILGIGIQVSATSSEINSVYKFYEGDILSFQTRLGGLTLNLLSSSEANLFIYKISEIAE